MAYLEESEKLVGYKVKTMHRGPFTVVGYTLIVPADHEEMIPRFWEEVIADGRLAELRKASGTPPWVLGLGSWDPECEKKGQRYTICIEETEHTDFSQLARAYALYHTTISESEWMCFELPTETPGAKFWRDNPYAMMKTLGYRFYTGGENTGLHFDAYPPGYDAKTSPATEFWITVTPRRKRNAQGGVGGDTDEDTEQ